MNRRRKRRNARNRKSRVELFVKHTLNALSLTKGKVWFEGTVRGELVFSFVYSVKNTTKEKSQIKVKLSSAESYRPKSWVETKSERTRARFYR